MSFIVKVDDRAVKKALMDVFRRMEEFPVAHKQAIAGIVGRGLRDGNRILSMGGTVMTPGGSIEWLRVRHPWTVGIRRSFFKDDSSDVFPILKLTGRLQAYLYKGTMSASRRSFVYRVPDEIAPLVEAHQRGLAPLPSLKSRGRRPPVGMRLAPRQMLFWSNAMAADVMAEAKRAAEGKGPGRGV